jgi:polyhydroxyalkanoate synthesis regulator phasin
MMNDELVSQEALDNASMDELAELADNVKLTQQNKRAEAKERVVALKEELSTLKLRRTKRTAAEPEAAEKPKRKKKRNRG